MALFAGVAGLGPSTAVDAAPLGSEPLATVDSVASQGAEMAVHVEASTWTPQSGSSVAWRVTVRNRSEAAASAEGATVWLGTGQGTSAATLGAVPPGWQVSWSSESGVSLWTDELFAPGASVSFVVTTEVSGASGSMIEVHASASATNQWEQTPRPGRWSVGRGVIDGTHLSGTVVADATGAPIGDVCVEASGAGWWSTSTRPDGSWDLAVASGSDATVRFEPRCQVDHHAGPAAAGLASRYAVRWWPGTSDPANATPVALTPDRSLGEVRLLDGGAVRGTVTFPDGIDPSSLWVSVETSGSGWWLEGGPVGDDGTFLVHGLPPGSHVVGVRHHSGGVAQRYYDGAGRRELATPVAVVGGVITTGVDIELEAAASLGGTVTDAETGAPLADISVQVRTESGEWVAGTSTTADGTYSIGALPVGSYLVRFDDWDGPYVRVWHDGSWSEGDVTPLGFAAGDTLSLDVAMTTGVSVSGRVTAAVAAHGLQAGDPISDVAVIAWAGGFSFDADPVSFATTSADGAFTIGGLPPTDVALAFVHGLDVGGDDEDDDLINADWAVQFWQGVSDPFAAGTLDLSGASGAVAGIDAQLLPAPVFTGRVLDAHGGTLAGATGLGGMAVGLFVAGDDEPFAFTMTEPDGSYRLASPFADFDVFIGSADIADTYDGAYPPRWHGGAEMVLDGSGPPDPLRDGAVPVRAAAGTTRADVHVVHDPPPAPGPPHLPATIDVEPGDGSVTVRWPVLELPVDEYLVLVDGLPEVSLHGHTGTAAARGGGVVASAAPMLETTVDGLTNGQDYEFTVVARNLGGEGTFDTRSATPGAGGPTPGGVGLGPVTTVPPHDPSPDTGTEPDPSGSTVPADGRPGEHTPEHVAEADPSVDGTVEQPDAGTPPAPVAGQLPVTGGSTVVLAMWALIALAMGCAVVVVAPRR